MNTEDRSSLILLSSVAFLSYVSFAFLNPVFGILFRELNYTDVDAGVAASAGGVFLIVGSIVWRPVLARKKLDSVLINALRGNLFGHASFAAVAALIVASHLNSATGYVLLIGARAASTFFFVAVQMALLARVGPSTNGSSSVRSLAFLNAANALGIVIGPMLGGVAGQISVLLPLWLVVAFPLAAITLSSRLPSQEPAYLDVLATPNPNASVGLQGRIFLWIAFVVLFCLSSLQLVMAYHIADQKSLFGADATRVTGLVLFFGGLGLVAGNIAVSLVRLDKGVLCLAAGLIVAAAGFCGMSVADSILSLSVVLFIAGLGLGVTMPIYTDLVRKNLADSPRAAGLLTLAQSLGMVFGPLTGVIFYTTGRVFGTMSALLLIAAALALATRGRVDKDT